MFLSTVSSHNALPEETFFIFSSSVFFFFNISTLHPFSEWQHCRQAARTWGWYWCVHVCVCVCVLKAHWGRMSCWRGFRVEGLSHYSFKSSQIKLFTAWKWPLGPLQIQHTQRPNMIVMDITPRRQQQNAETSVDRETKPEQTFPPGGPGNVDGPVKRLFNLLKVNGETLKQMQCDRPYTHWDTQKH